MKSVSFFSVLLGAASVLAAPAPLPAPEAATNPLAILSLLQSSVINNAVAAGDFQGVLTALQSVTPVTAPAQLQDAITAIQTVGAANTTNIYNYIALQRSLGLVGDINSVIQYVQGVLAGESSSNNNNPPPPARIYPRANPADPLYDIPESKLRGAIYIPPTFTRGAKPPIILVPGTGETGYTSFGGNFIPLLTNVPWADPVWLNVPGFMWDDIQNNAEYVAYAINYIASVTGRRDITVAGWSQGSIACQWTYKYWLSARSLVTDQISISGDYDGTVEANLFFPPGVIVPPALLQQRYLASSRFITTLQRNNGDSAYVPTTSVYSALFDEVVEPQQGVIASAYVNNARGVGASNNEVQSVCPPGSPGGSFYTHEGLLYNPLAFALLQDAMTNPGPANPARLNLPAVCSNYLAPGLNVGNLLTTEATIVVAGVSLLLYPGKVLIEPPIKPYALLN